MFRTRTADPGPRRCSTGGGFPCQLSQATALCAWPSRSWSRCSSGLRRSGSRLPYRRCLRDHRQCYPDDHDNPPLTTEELAWLDALTKMKKTFEKKRDKVLRQETAGVSRALEALLGKTVGACSRDLARVGPPPSDRLQPVYTLANKACQQFTKAARCHATVVRLSLPSGGVVVGSPQERPWKQASRCAQTAGDKGLELLSQASAKGVEIQVETG